VEVDVGDRLGRYFTASDVGDVPAGFSRSDDFGEGGIVEGGSDATSAFTFVRWRWAGYHSGAIPSRAGSDVVAATGNDVVVEGLTVVEDDRGDRYRARWFVDWLSVYAQLGVVTLGRPTKVAHIELRSSLDPVL
jgi:hypothetical protein